MDPEITHCLTHMLLVQNAVQCLLNAAAFLIGPFRWHYLPPFLPIGFLTFLFSAYTIRTLRFRLIVWYITFLTIGFVYRIYVVVDMFLYRNELLKIAKNCDEYDLVFDIDASTECDMRLDFKILALNLINAITFHCVAAILDIFLIIISIRLRFAFKYMDEQRLLLLTVQYDENCKVVNKYLRDRYGTFRVLAEDGSLNNEVDFLKGSLLKANYFAGFESSYECSSYERDDGQSEFYETAEFDLGGQQPIKIEQPNTSSQPARRAKDIYERFDNYEYVSETNVQTNEKINDEIMRKIVKNFTESGENNQTLT